jgi:hypothetical protein
MQDRPAELQKGCLKMDLTKFALVVMKNVRDFVQPALDAIDRRIDEVKAAVEDLRANPPLDQAAIDAIVAKALQDIPRPVNGKDADPEAIMAAARAAVAEIPPPELSMCEHYARKDALKAEVESAVKDAIDAMPRAEDGASITLEDVAPLVDEAVSRAVRALPPANDGVSVTPEQVLPELRAALQEAIRALPVPADGKSITVDDVLPVLESMHAKWALDFERRAQDLFQRAIDRMPAPKNGTDGKDGLGFDDMTFEQVDERSAVLRFERNGVMKIFPIALAGFVDRGLWQEGQFVKGDGVTWEGNYWLARRDTKAKPGSEGEDIGNNDWRLAVRKGRKGKDGAPGRDLRSVTAKLSP